MSSKQQIYTVAIVGTGRIASGFDTPSSREVLTHAHAAAKNTRLKLIGMTDIDTVEGKKASKKWGVSFFSTLAQLLDANPDIVVIATPDKSHAKVLLSVSRAKNRPKLIICEKPLMVNKKELTAIKNISSLPTVLVNYSLRFDPLFADIRKDIIGGVYGKIISAHATYSHGFFHNGSHTIDIARFFFGEMKNCKAVFATYDAEKGDPSLGGVATFARCPSRRRSWCSPATAPSARRWRPSGWARSTT